MIRHARKKSLIGKGNTKIVLHHNHATGKFVRWACVNCNSRYPFDTLGEHIKDVLMRTIVLGPPGTGKTTTLLNKVDDYLKTN